MQLEQISMERLEIPFKQSFSHAAARRKTTETVIVKAISSSGIVAYGEGCPRLYVTGETTVSALQFFEKISTAMYSIQKLDDLRLWVESNRMEINANPAAWCAVELACLDLLAREAGRSVECLLGLPELSGSFQYSAVIGAEEPAAFTIQLQRYLQLGLTDFKIKLSGDFVQDQENITLLRNQPVQLAVRLDANNWGTDAIQVIEYIQALDYSFCGIEEPLSVNDYAGCRNISTALELPVILDESFLNGADFENLIDSASCWIINLRVSKMGGILRALEVADTARELEVPLVIGAHVGETSILTRAALTVAHACRNQVIAQEGAFGTYLLEKDVVRNPLMFGKKGNLDVSRYCGKTGFSMNYHFHESG